MNHKDARIIANTITNEQLQSMLDTAKANIKDWTKVSNVNKGMTKGSAWNILAKGFDPTARDLNNLIKTNMIREFGEYLPDELKPKKKTHRFIPPFHQNPIF